MIINNLLTKLLQLSCFEDKCACASSISHGLINEYTYEMAIIVIVRQTKNMICLKTYWFSTLI